MTRCGETPTLLRHRTFEAHRGKMSLEMGPAAGLRIRTPGLDRPGFAQSVLDSMRDDALTMAQN
jgi:hypothetical protein